MNRYTLFALLALTACGEPSADPETLADVAVIDDMGPVADMFIAPDSPDPIPLGEDPALPVGLEPPHNPEGPPTRPRRRMNLDQLNKAMIQVSDGIAWEVRGVNQFDQLSATLGRPDYIQITAEVLEPTALFQKFLDDAARSVCARMIDRDEDEGRSELLPGDRAQTENLQRLVLKFHSRDLPIESAELQPWVWLADSAAFVSHDQSMAWWTVCVGLFTHPDFYSY